MKPLALLLNNIECLCLRSVGVFLDCFFVMGHPQHQMGRKMMQRKIGVFERKWSHWHYYWIILSGYAWEVSVLSWIPIKWWSIHSIRWQEAWLSVAVLLFQCNENSDKYDIPERECCCFFCIWYDVCSWASWMMFLLKIMRHYFGEKLFKELS